VTGNKGLINDLGAIIQSRVVCQDVVSQYILKEYLKSGSYDKNLKQINKDLKQKKELMYEKLKDSIHLGLDMEQPKGGVFLWGKLPQGCNEKYLQSILKEKGVSYMPGNVFFGERRGDVNYVRFCYYCRTENEIIEGINIFNKSFAESMNV
jgi:2-aminoadipate transaminase